MKDTTLGLMFVLAAMLTILEFHLYRTDRKRISLYMGLFCLTGTALIAVTLINYWAKN